MHRVLPTVLTLMLLSLGCSNQAQAAGLAELFLTADQQAQRAFDAGRWGDAAELFTDPERKGAALYRDGEFELAAAVLGRSTSAEAAYNRGNALLMLGRYDDAMVSYERALAQRPDWPEARDNSKLAALRKARLAPPDDDAGGTGGKLEADEIVFEDSARMDAAKGEQVVDGETAPLSDAALRALWLRRVDTRPGDFLRVRFAGQLASGAADAPEEAAPGG